MTAAMPFAALNSSDRPQSLGMSKDRVSEVIVLQPTLDEAADSATSAPKPAARTSSKLHNATAAALRTCAGALRAAPVARSSGNGGLSTQAVLGGSSWEAFFLGGRPYCQLMGIQSPMPLRLSISGPARAFITVAAGRGAVGGAAAGG